jgi:tetratricopeptide (TPR) repeat protein
VTPVLASIQQLPEIDMIYQENKFPSRTAIDNLIRATDVFSSFGKGGREHLAACALLAECQQRLALYEDSLETLTEMQKLLQEGVIPNSGEDLTLAKAKACWTNGDFDQSEALCDSIITTYNDLEETFQTTNLHMASAMSGKALSQLASMKTLDDAYSVRDYFRITIKFLERHPSTANNLPQAVAYSNCGTAEAIYALFLEETNDVSVPMDSALRCWFQGLQQTEGQKSAHLKMTSNTLQANMRANLAWGVLNYETDRSDSLEKASDYAKKALSAHDAENGASVAGMRRVLSIVASCYHKAGSAVIAEGLFQSATDEKSLLAGPTMLLELQDAYLGYAELCKQWEKRESDAKRLEQEAININNRLSDGWKGKSGIHSSLWFWTPCDFL